MTAASEFKAHWRVVLGAGLGLGSGFTAYHYTASLFISELVRAFGWTRGQVSSAMAAALVGALCTPLLGRLIDRVGVRRVVALGTLGVGLGYFALSLQSGSLALFALTIAATATVGLASGALAYTRAVAGWFDAGRGLALGLTIGGVSLAAILLPPLLASVIASDGWRTGYRLLGLIAVGVGLPMLLLFVRERRDVVGTADAETGLAWREAFATPTFKLLVAAVFLVHGAGSGVVGQLAPLLGDKGFPRPAIALYLSALGASVLFGRLVLGALLDRLSTRAVGAFACALPALGCLILLSPQLSGPLALLAVVAVGVSQGAELDLIAYVVARWFGMRAYSTIFGTLIGVIAAAGAGGIAFFGNAFDATGNYDLPLIVAAVAAPLGALLVWLIGRPPERQSVLPVTSALGTV